MGSPVHSPEPATGSRDIGDMSAEPKRHGAWATDPKTLGLVALIAFLLLGMFALASAIDLSDLSPDAVDQAAGDIADAPGSGLGDLGEDPGGQGGAGGLDGADLPPFGGDGGGRLDLGGNGANDSVDLAPLPGCPGAFRIGNRILIVPDPEACGLVPAPPGSPIPENGPIILSPSPDGDIGGFRIGSDGDVELLAPGDVRGDDLVIGINPDGSYGLGLPDGSRVELVPDRDGDFSIRDEQGNQIPLAPPRNFEPPVQPNPDTGFDQPDVDQPDNDEPADLSPLAFAALAVLLAGLLAFVIYSLTNMSKAAKDVDDDDVDDDRGVQDDLVDYSIELSALDRLLWEIDQEADPRTAIRRVYAALETGLDNPEMARRRSETPGRYLRRILGRFDELEAPLHDLTLLFEQARFSEHEITEAMRDRAVQTLVAVRGHYAHVTALAAQQRQVQDTVIPG